ncbi:MAG: hypothetical protein WC752_01350 [Patescibacteria group bacterium]|jgi:hypothetical protein
MRVELLLSLIVFSLLLFVRADIVLLVAYIILAGYFIWYKKKHNFARLALATIITLIWAYLGREQYGYNHDYLSFFGINFLPLFAWSLGLTGIYTIFLLIKKYFVIEKKYKDVIIFLVVYWSALLLIETIGYHAFNVHDLQTALYEGLPICDCMHAPNWMRAVYFLLGPLFFIICYVLKLEKLESEPIKYE